MKQFIALSIIALCVCASQAQTAPKLLPFQGRLTDQNGIAVTNGVRLVQFKIFAVPSGGSPVWAGELHRTTVNGGLVNVLLGSKTAFSGIDFDRQLYLEITVDINGDNTITAADPPMLPRQVLLPFVFAKESANSRLLGGYDWSSIMTGGNTNPSVSTIAETKMPAGIVVPVGAVIMWWGNVSGIPANFELCDGSAPSTTGATLGGNKPDLRDRFVKGAMGATTDVKSAPIRGGTNTSPLLSLRTDGTAITLAQMPSHSHGVTDPGHAHKDIAHNSSPPFGTLPGPVTLAYFPGEASGDYNLVSNERANISVNAAGNGQTHDHALTVPATDNRPAFLELFFIIRVK